MRTYYLTTESIRTFYKFRAGNVNSVTLLNKFTVSYKDIQMTTCILTLQFTCMELWRQDYLLGSMAAVVNLSKCNTYLAILLVWCMSGAPRVFVSNTCAHVELIRSGVLRVFDGKRVPMMSYSCGAPCEVERVLVMSLLV